MQTINVPVYISVIILISLLMSFYIQFKYANRTMFRMHTYITIFCQYFCTFCLMLLAPLDLTITLNSRSSINNLGHYKNNYHTIFLLYMENYLIITLLSNVVLVIQEQYNSNGFFTIFSRFRNTLWQLSLQIIACIIIFVILFGILVGTNTINPNSHGLFLTSILTTNTVWMTFLMLVLGYGLLVYPIDMWNRGNYEHRLNKLQIEIAKEFENVTHSYSDIFACISNIKQTEREIKLQPEKYQHLLLPLEILLKDLPIDINFNTHLGNVIVNKQLNEITIGSLANFREKLYWSNALFTASQSRLNYLQTKAHFLEDILDSLGEIAEIESQIEGHKHIAWSFKEKSTYYEYIWYTSIKPILYKITGFICGILSLCTYLGIVSTVKNIPSYISPYFDIIKTQNMSPQLTIFIAFITIGYLFFVVKWSLFEMKFFKSLIFVNNRSTWPIPMSFNSRIFGSLVCPFIFVYLSLFGENDINNADYPQTTFSNFYQMKAIPLNSFFPILLLVVTLLTSLNLINLLLISLKCSGFQFGVPEVSEESLENGKEKLSKRKKIIKRAYKQSLQKINNNVEITKKKNGLIDFVMGFNKRSKFHSQGSFIDNENSDEKVGNLDYSSLTITQEQFHENHQKYSFKDLGKRMDSISEMFTKYDTRAPQTQRFTLEREDENV